MRASPHIRVSFDMVCSKYKRAGIPIYRADLPGGPVWGFYYGRKIYLGHTLDSVRTMIDEVTGKINSKLHETLVYVNPSIQYYFEEEDE